MARTSKHRRLQSTVKQQRRIALVIEDELLDLISALQCLPDLHVFVRTMKEIEQPTDVFGPSADRVGELFHELLGRPIGEDDPPIEPQWRDAFIHDGIQDAPNVIAWITAMVQMRLCRLAALIHATRRESD